MKENIKTVDFIKSFNDSRASTALKIPPMPTASPHFVESDTPKMLDFFPLFLRTVAYNCDTGKRRTEISILGPRHLYHLDTSETPLLPFIDGIPYIKDEQEQIRYIEMFKKNPSMYCTFITQAEIITLQEYNTFYLKK